MKVELFTNDERKHGTGLYNSNLGDLLQSVGNNLSHILELLSSIESKNVDTQYEVAGIDGEVREVADYLGITLK